MIRQAVIVAEAADKALDQFLGLSLIKRVILTMNRSGVGRAFVIVDAADSAISAALADDPAYARAGIELLVGSRDTIREQLAGPILIARADEVYSDALIELAARSEVSDARAFRAGGLIAASPSYLDGEVEAEHIDIGDAFWHSLDTPQATRRAEKQVLVSLIKSHDGPIARNVIRRLSLPITRYFLCKTGIRPNHMTLFASSLGLIGAWFIFQATWKHLAIGAGLIFAQSVFDHTDGELSRLKFLGSNFGAWLDHVSDDVLSTLYAVAFGWAAAELTGQPIWWTLGLASTAGITLFHLVHYSQLAFVNKSGDPFKFRWWFQKRDDLYLKTEMSQAGLFGRVVEAFHATGRRDVYVFAFMIFSFARIPQAAVVWYFVVAMTHAALSIVHVAAGGMAKRPRENLP